MSRLDRHGLLDQLQRWLTTEADDATPDAVLLERFGLSGDEAAFAALLRRYGPLVLRVCRRQLYDHHDVEDAFQATFLVLARKATSIVRKQAIGGWLYSVAFRAARKLRLAKRPAAPAGLEECPAPAGRDEASWRELVAGVDEELARLPEKYRLPIVLCYLQGQTQLASAKQLRLPLRTLEYRLSHGRELLRKRLVRRGIEWSAALVALEVSASAVPAALQQATAGAAIRFVGEPATKGVAASSRVETLACGLIESLTPSRWQVFVALSLIAAGLVGASAGLFAPSLPTALSTVPNGEDTKTDGHGDRLPRSAVARLGTVRWRQDSLVGHAVFLGTGKAVLTLGEDSVRVWEAASGRLLRHFSAKPFAPLASPDGRLLAGSNASERSIHVWDTETGKELWHVNVPAKGGLIKPLAFSRDSQSLAFTGADGSIWVREARTGKAGLSLPRATEGTESWPLGVSFASDGKHLAVLNYDGVVRLWDLATLKVVHSLGEALPPKGSTELSHVQPTFAPDGKTLTVVRVAPQKDKRSATITVWNLETGKRIHEIKGMSEGNEFHAFLTADARHIAWADAGGVVRVYSLAEGKELMSVPAKRVIAVCLTGDGAALAVARDVNSQLVFHVHDVATEKVRWTRHHLQMTHLLQFSPDNKLLLAGTGGGNLGRSVRLWSSSDGTPLSDDGHQGSVYQLGVSADGHTLTSSGGAEFALRRWNPATGESQKPFEPNAGSWPVAVSPDGRHAAYAIHDKNVMQAIQLWDIERGVPLVRLDTPKLSLFRAAFTPDAKHFVVCAGGIQVWDMATGKPVPLSKEVSPNVPAVQGSWPTMIAMSQDGSLLASASIGSRDGLRTGVIQLWRLPDGRLDDSLQLPAGRLVMALALARDGRSLAIAEKSDGADKKPDAPPASVAVWELATHGKRDQFEFDSGALAFSPDGRTLAVGGIDGTIRFRSQGSALEGARFERHLGPVRILRFFDGGRRLASGSDDTSILRWDSAVATAHPVRDVAVKEPDRLWADLGVADASLSQRAMRTLL
ncbi:MAG: sigma-70 family RNA polymerase sigma factor, partial [Gemmataceae bacterium]